MRCKLTTSSVRFGADFFPEISHFLRASLTSLTSVSIVSAVIYQPAPHLRYPSEMFRVAQHGIFLAPRCPVLWQWQNEIYYRRKATGAYPTSRYDIHLHHAFTCLLSFEHWQNQSEAHMKQLAVRPFPENLGRSQAGLCGYTKNRVAKSWHRRCQQPIRKGKKQKCLLFADRVLPCRHRLSEVWNKSCHRE